MPLLFTWTFILTPATSIDDLPKCLGSMPANAIKRLGFSASGN
ncbi:hypothetical protein [Vulcanisaeta sp. JCM 16161]